MTGIENPFQDEARERWGGTEAWQESQRRTRGYGPEQLRAIKAELEEIESRFARLLEDGSAPDSPSAVAAAEDARKHIDRWYYRCPPSMHAALAEMYVTDPRFRAHYEDRSAGLAEFVSAAIRANADEGGNDG